MSGKVGCVIEPIDGGKSADLSDNGGSSGNESGSQDTPIVDFGSDRIEPSTYRIPEPPDTGTRRNRRGGIDGRTRAARAARTADTGTPATESKSNLVELSLKDLLLSVHNIGSMMLKVEELALEETEAEKLAVAIQEVGKYYHVSFDPKKIAIANLAIVTCQIYGFRIMAYQMRLKNEKASRGPMPVKTTEAKPQVVNGDARPKPDQPRMRQPHEMTPSDIWPESAGVD